MASKKTYQIHDSFGVLKLFANSKSGLTIEKVVKKINNNSDDLNFIQLQNIVSNLEFWLNEKIIIIKEGVLWLNYKN